MYTFEVISSQILSAEQNMRLAEQQLKNLDNHSSIVLHFYRWERPSITYGYFSEPHKFLRFDYLQTHHFDLARRPTGGGILFHTHDLAFALTLPAEHPKFSLNTLNNYALINNAVAEALQSCLDQRPTLLDQEPIPLDAQCGNFCLAKPTKYDLMLQGRKVAGAAQRRTHGGLLHQGSISLHPLSSDFLVSALLPGSAILEAMLATMPPPLPISTPDLEKALIQSLQQALQFV